MSTLKDRLIEARKEAGLSQAGLAKLAGCGQTTVASIENGRNQGSTALARIAEVLHVEALWLSEGRGEKRRSKDTTQPDPANVAPAVERQNRVPLVSWVQAGDWRHAADLLQPGEGYEWIETSLTIRDHTFALRVQGDSMEPEFTHGMIVLVEPDMDPHPGDYVIARNGSDEATFKQLIKDGTDYYLKPVNPRYPIKPLGTARIIGVVRESVKKYR